MYHFPASAPAIATKTLGDTSAPSRTLPTVSIYLQSVTRESGAAIIPFQVTDQDLDKALPAHACAQCVRLRAAGVLWSQGEVNSYHADLAHDWSAFLLVERRKPEPGSITTEQFAVRFAKRKSRSPQNCKNVILDDCRARLRSASINTWISGLSRLLSHGCGQRVMSTMKHCCDFTSVQRLAPGPWAPLLRSISRASTLRC